MRLTFLGTGPAIAIPRKDHTDRVCLAGGKSRRLRSSALLVSGRTKLLIDCGPDVLEQLKRTNISRIHGVVLTHGHADAAGGVKKLDHWLTRQKNKLTVPLITDRVTWARIQKTQGPISALCGVILENYKPLQLGDIQITPLPVKHAFSRGFPTLGFLFNRDLAYASDFHDLPSETIKHLRGVPTLVLDGAAYFGTHIPSHLSADQAIRWAERLETENLFLTQIGHSYPPHEVAQLAVDHFLKDHDIKKPSLVRLTYDGLKITIG